jgi:hypothetical protein
VPPRPGVRRPGHGAARRRVVHGPGDRRSTTGETLDERASPKTSRTTTLVSSITAGMKAAALPVCRRPRAGPQQDRAAIASGKRPGGPPPSGGGNRADGADRLSSLAAALGVDPTTLLEQLQSGDGRVLLDPGIPYARTAGLWTQRAAGRLRRLSDRGRSASRPMLRPPVAHRVIRRILREFFGCAACVLRRPGLPVRHASIPLPASCRCAPGHPGMRPRGRRLRRIRQQRL